MDYRQKLLALARQHNVRVRENQTHYQTSRANCVDRAIEVAPVRCETTFMVALHELGHIIEHPAEEEELRSWMRRNPAKVHSIIASAIRTGRRFASYEVLPRTIVQNQEARATAWSLRQHIPSPKTAKMMLAAHRSYDDYEGRTPLFHQVHEQLRALCHS